MLRKPLTHLPKLDYLSAGRAVVASRLLTSEPLRVSLALLGGRLCSNSSPAVPKVQIQLHLSPSLIRIGNCPKVSATYSVERHLKETLTDLSPETTAI